MNKPFTEPVKYKRGQHPNSRKNLKPFPKGVNGYLATGHATTQLNLTLRLKRVLAQAIEGLPPGATVADLLVKSTIEGAIALNPTAFREVWDRVEGKVSQPVQGNGEVNHNIVFRVGRGYDAETEAREGVIPRKF